MHHATGTFEVKVTPEAQTPAPPEKILAKPMRLVGTLISAGVPKPGSSAAYVALDQFRGSLDGRGGGFVLVHRGTLTRQGGADLQVIVAPDSGIGQLAGIAGELTIRTEGSKHFYDFAYTLPGSK